MTTNAETINRPIESFDSSPERGRIMPRIDLSYISIRQIAPISDWIALLLLFWMLSMVAWSVQLARWGDLPNILPTILIAATTAFAMSRLKISILIKIIVFFALGTAIVFWQASIPADGSNVIARSIDAYNRFELWIDIAVNGGVSGDSVPFAMIFMTVSWTVSYIVTALTFRYRSSWIPVLMLGFAILTNLSHRQGQYEYTFYLFIIAAVAQFAHLIAVNRLERWQEAGLKPPPESMWTAARDGIMLGALVMLIAAIMPLFEPRSVTLRDRWNAVFLDPLQRFQSTAERLLAGIPGRDDGLLDAPDFVMPFRGGIELTDDPIMWIRSRYAKLHPARIFHEYTPSGWISNPSVIVPAPAQTRITEHPTELGIEKRELIPITVQPVGGSELVIPAAAVHTVDQKTNVEVLEPIAWNVPLVGPIGEILELPQDLSEFSIDLRLRLMNIANQRSAQAESFSLEDHPPLDIQTVSDTIMAMRQQSEEQTQTYPGETIRLSLSVRDLQNVIVTDESESFTLQVSADDLAYMLGTMPEDETDPINVNLVTSPQDMANARGDALAAARNDVARTLADIELQFNDMISQSEAIPWESFDYNIFAESNSTDASFMRIVRKAPSQQNTVTFEEPLEPNQQYQVGTYVSTADNDDLSQSGDLYPLWVTDRYLQLPESLPQRVSDLSRRVVADAEATTPWEKIQAIKAFLQSQVYSLEIQGPGPFDDGVDYFLFQTQSEPCPSDLPACDVAKIKGYSQYYGSAGTVMLRSVGIPARMIAGWSAGEYVPEEGQFIIRDRNRHGWTQAYLPPYGWIDIEVTPGRPSIPRNLRVPTVPISDIPPQTVGSAEFDPDFLEDLLYLDSLALEARQFLSSRRDLGSAQAQGGTEISIPWIVMSASSISILLLLVALVIAWQWNLRGLPYPVRAYSQFIRIAGLLGYRRQSHQSAREYTAKLSSVSERFAQDYLTLIRQYERVIYGNKDRSHPKSAPNPSSLDTHQDSQLPESETQAEHALESQPQDETIDTSQDLGVIWRRMSRALAAHRIKRIIGLAPPISDNPLS